MKVLLMIEREGRVVSVGPCKPFARGTEQVIGPEPGYVLSFYQRYWHDRADRWWLVEAESAEAARVLIAKFEQMQAVGGLMAQHGTHLFVVAENAKGRILASGGRS